LYDLAYTLRAANRTVIGGFQTLVEKECLRVFLNSGQNVIICLPRGIDEMRIPAPWQRALKEQRLLLLSIFPGSMRRATATSAAARNRFIADIADEVLFAHAAPGSSTEGFLRELREAGRKVAVL
jgi:predicted Rossmann fold nucleotide-binding protein DprA/Smf involved in DNA uptake